MEIQRLQIMKAYLVVMALVAAALLVPSSMAQIKSCGDLELFIANPDMRDVGSDGKYHVAGDFYMQFQVQGEGASDIESFGFSVGLPPENPEEICQTPEPLPMWAGFMLESYKADFDKSDGFFILMSTTGESTPQNTDLTVSVHAYDAAGTEKARFWTTAVVESCEASAGIITPGGCAADDVVANDNIKPWPMILPGDGPEDFANGIYIDFAEELSALTVYLNGDDITDQLNDITDDDGSRKQWDDDTYYDHGPAGIGSTLTNPCESPQTCKSGEGPAFEWTERKMTPDDVVRVEATDLAGNSVVKEIHMAQAAAGGTLEGGIPILEMTFDESSLTGAPGEMVSFHMVMENTGSGEGHPFEHPWTEGVNKPEGWADPVWDPGHSPVPPGGQSEQTLLVTIPQNTSDGTYKLTPRMDYKQAGVDNSVQSVINVVVETPEDAALDTDSVAPEEQESPATGILLAFLALAAVAFVRTRKGT